MKLLADIPIGRATVPFLRSKGHDVVHVRDLMSASAGDESTLEAVAA